MSIDMRGRRVVVTGATTGIGKETARELRKMGANVVIVGRDPKKIDETVREIGGESVRCDFASLASVRAAATELSERFPEIHVLVNNAGAVYMERSVTVDGHETSFQVNHLGPYLLTRKLLPSIQRAARPERRARIVNVASTVHGSGRVDWDDLHTTRGSYVGLRVYSATKLMNVMFTGALARRLAPSTTANSLHPGVIASGFGSNNKGWMGFGVRVVAPFLPTPAKGARTSIYLASSAEVENVTGKYFDERSREIPSSVASRDENAQERLWQISEELCGDSFP
jgi:NAD(P)-dependent dehydrogenase (short-subunit alcohol dehydrogenase family)